MAHYTYNYNYLLLLLLIAEIVYEQNTLTYVTVKNVLLLKNLFQATLKNKALKMPIIGPLSI